MTTTATPNPDGFLSSGGEMGERMRAFDWSTSTLGEPAGWPGALKTAVSICLSSRFPMLLWWGPELTMIYNDPYVPVLGDKHPAALGSSGESVWPEIWDVIGPMLAGVVERGEATWSRDQLLVMNRNGYDEETYFTFSYSAIRDADGAVAGVFTAVTETTEQVLGTRRLAALAHLADVTSLARTRADAARAAVAAFDHAREDVPFALLYMLDEEGEARLAGARGLQAGTALVPERVHLDGDDGPWDLAAIARGAEARSIDGLAIDTRAGVVVDRAHVQPIARLGSATPAAVLVLGVNPRREIDADYRSFLQAIGRQIASALAGAEGFESETARADALADVDRAKTTFFSNVSHEFRTPLMLMLGPLADALGDPAPTLAEQHDRVELVNRGALRLLRLVNALLDFSRMEAGRASASFVPVDLGRIARETAAVFRAATDRSGLELTVDVPDGEQVIEADPDMIEKILLNLVSNAYKFTFEGGIELRIRLSDRAVIEVIDSGVGVAEDELPRLFERFHRVEGSQGRSHEGSGIGLSLVRELVALHDGTVGVTSVVGTGTTFRVELPLAQPDVVTMKHVDPLANEALRAGFGQEALRWGGEEVAIGLRSAEAEAELLIVDDNADLREYLARLLAPRYAVRTAIDGEDALAKLRERPADLVLTDVMMPRMNGHELLRRLRENPRTRRLPVIMLSARAGEEAAVEGLDAGADDYLVKPFAASELMARVHANLEVVRLRDALAAAERDRAVEIEQVALTLQRSLLPHALPDVPGAELAGRYVPAGSSLEIGGDFYDATALGDGRVVVAIGDVAGHGVLAAAIMSQIRQAVRAYALERHLPGALMERLDRLVYDGRLMMTTCLCGIFDPADGSLRYSNAGHPPPLIRRADGSVERLEGALSQPLGVTIDGHHVEAEVRLAVGDSLLLYTDGVVERRGRAIDVGIDNLAGVLGEDGAGASSVCERIAGVLGGDLRDDAAFLALRREPLAGDELHAVLPARPSELAGLRRRLTAWLVARGADAHERGDIVLAVHEAAMNAVEHAYGPADANLVVAAVLRDGVVEVEVRDRGRWRESRRERRGRGEGIMKGAMDEVTIERGEHGSTVRLRRRLSGDRQT